MVPEMRKLMLGHMKVLWGWGCEQIYTPPDITPEDITKSDLDLKYRTMLGVMRPEFLDIDWSPILQNLDHSYDVLRQLIVFRNLFPQGPPQGLEWEPETERVPQGRLPPGFYSNDVEESDEEPEEEPKDGPEYEDPEASDGREYEDF